MYHVTLYTVYSLVRATFIVYSYIVTAIGATTLTGYRSSEDQVFHPYEPPKQQPPKQRVRRENEEFNVRRNKQEPAVPLRWRNIGRKG